MLGNYRIKLLGAAMLLAAGVSTVYAQATVKVGLIVPMTGPQASTGKQIEAAVKLYMQQKGNMAGGKKVELIVKDDGAVPDNTRRVAQELIVNDKVSFIAGFGVTPAALAAAPLATQAKVPLVVMALPLYDMISVITLRIRERRNPMVGDRRHFSHRLVRRGMNVRTAVYTIYLCTGGTSIAASLLMRVDDIGAILVFAQTLAILLILALLEMGENKP